MRFALSTAAISFILFVLPFASVSMPMDPRDELAVWESVASHLGRIDLRRLDQVSQFHHQVTRSDVVTIHRLLNEHGEEALARAIELEKPEGVVTALFREYEQENVQFPSEDIQLLFQYAVFGRFTELVSRMLGRTDIDVHEENDAAFRNALQQNDVEMMQIFFRYHPEFLHSNSRSILESAVLSGRVDLAQRYLQNGAPLHVDEPPHPWQWIDLLNGNDLDEYIQDQERDLGVLAALSGNRDMVDYLGGLRVSFTAQHNKALALVMRKGDRDMAFHLMHSYRARPDDRDNLATGYAIEIIGDSIAEIVMTRPNRNHHADQRLFDMAVSLNRLGWSVLLFQAGHVQVNLNHLWSAVDRNRVQMAGFLIRIMPATNMQRRNLIIAALNQGRMDLVRTLMMGGYPRLMN